MRFLLFFFLLTSVVLADGEISLGAGNTIESVGSTVSIKVGSTEVARFDADGGLRLPDSGTVPAAEVGFATIIVDPADGITKVRKSTGDGSALISLEAGGISALFVEDAITPSAAQTAFSLSGTYVGAGGHSTVCVNTLCGYERGVHYTISGTTMTWIPGASFPMAATDRVVVKTQTQ